ncbi:MAG TPA: methyltransferase domain-containing protein [bacterium]|nr:methyltransferase domain-containing protein [bacterium]
MKEVSPYTKLAEIYDVVMSYIDYEVWVEYLHVLCLSHDKQPGRTLDISCGTGNSVPYLQSWCGELYCMDLNTTMIQQLVRKHVEMRGRAWVGDMSALPVKTPFDLIINLQDSVNYYLDPDEITLHLGEIYPFLSQNGAYIFDFSTADNIRNNFIDLHEIYEDDDYGYERVNTFHMRKHLNETEFFIWELVGGEKRTYKETHLQRMYTEEEIEACLQESPFGRWYMYEDETLHPPTGETERVHVVTFPGEV